jgi:hypothetical protein
MRCTGSPGSSGACYVGAKRVFDGETPRVVVLVTLLDAMVCTGKEDFDRARIESYVLEQPTQRRPRPLRGAHHLVQPGLADRSRDEARATIPCALHRHRRGDSWPLSQRVQPELELGRDPATDP